MMRTARVTSVDALRDFKADLLKFGQEAEKALIEVDMEVQRLTNWLESEQSSHWQRQLRVRHEKVEAAKADVRRIQMTIADRPPSAAEQKKALRIAQQREEEARQKIAAVRRWRSLLQREVTEYRGQAQQLAGALDADIPTAVGLMNRLIESIEQYLALAPPPETADAAAGSSSVDETSMARVDDGEIRWDPLRPLGKKERAALRRQIPDPESRAKLELTEPSFAGDAGEPLETFEPGILERLDLEPAVSDSQDKVILARGALTQERCFLSRQTNAAGADSGWYLGVMRSDDDSPPMEAVCIFQLVQERPDLRELLSLPAGEEPGLLVLLDQSTIRAIYDASGDDLWRPALSGGAKR